MSCNLRGRRMPPAKQNGSEVLAACLRTCVSAGQAKRQRRVCCLLSNLCVSRPSKMSATCLLLAAFELVCPPAKQNVSDVFAACFRTCVSAGQAKRQQPVCCLLSNLCVRRPSKNLCDRRPSKTSATCLLLAFEGKPLKQSGAACLTP